MVCARCLANPPEPVARPGGMPRDDRDRRNAPRVPQAVTIVGGEALCTEHAADALATP